MAKRYKVGTPLTLGKKSYVASNNHHGWWLNETKWFDNAAMFKEMGITNIYNWVDNVIGNDNHNRHGIFPFIPKYEHFEMVVDKLVDYFDGGIDMNLSPEEIQEIVDRGLAKGNS